MANFYEPTADNIEDWARWLKDRPAIVREAAIKLLPWKLYRLSGQHRVVIVSYDEPKNGDPVTLTVAVTGKFNLVEFDRQVFGVKPEDLEECELPALGEPVGTLMTAEEFEENIDVMRVRIRPDLWELDANGKAVRKR